MSLRVQVEPAESRRNLADIYGPIADELAATERIFQHELGSRFPFVQHLVDHCSDFQGKRLRPALVLLTARACGNVTDSHPVLAAVVEMIHTATLVHDDILDDSMVRRHAATVNAEWGNETAVLLGDYLFTHAFHLAASLESARACRWIGHATNMVCEGEMQQVHHRGNLELSESEYFAIIEGKTAELTAVCCRLGAAYAGVSESTVSALDRYGRGLGIAFQIADDVLDILGDERHTGKSLGTDLEKQKLTLPVIHLLHVADPETRGLIRQWLGESNADHRKRLRPYLEASGSIDYAWQRAKQHVKSSLDALECLDDSDAKSMLRYLVQYVVRRVA